MSKKIIAAFAAAALLIASGCSGNTPAQTTEAATESKSAETTTAAAESGEEDIEDLGDSDEDDASTGKKVSGFAMSVKGSTGKLNISRAPKKSKPMGDSGTWSIFVYLCGTDLESGDGSATGDILQMIEAEANDNIKFVIQTGGTSQWMNNTFDAGKSERWLIENNDTTLIESNKLMSMGNPNTLSDFLNWGIKNYPAEKMGVIFWDHGGGSITGACFDELNDNDSLTLSELNTAFSNVYGNMTDKFEFIGFDCCLMSTVETANILATYARYFYGSQETEPGTGWDYTAICDFLAKNNSANGAELGKAVADSFYEECAAGGEGNDSTFSIIDLEKLDDFTIAFNDFANELYNAGLDSSKLNGIVKGINAADNFGGNNRAEGYTNMVDIGGIVRNCEKYADGSAVMEALNNCIIYNKNGKSHKNASGLSVYYPLQIQGSEELTTFSGICISPYYLSLVDMVAKGYSDNGYTNSVFFTEDGDWGCEDCSCYSCDDDSYFYCDEDSCGSGTSELISFAEGPYVYENGVFGFQLDETSYEYTADVRASICADYGDIIVELGETCDINADWDDAIFYDNFDGYWIALPNGEVVATYIVDYTDEYTVYTSPIYYNGKEKNLRLRQYYDGNIVVEGAWDGISSSGCASRDVQKFKAGDEIVPVFYYAYEGEVSSYTGDAYIWQEGDEMGYGYLPASVYKYTFDIYDIYGDCYSTEYAEFEIDEEGNILFL